MLIHRIQVPEDHAPGFSLLLARGFVPFPRQDPSHLHCRLPIRLLLHRQRLQGSGCDELLHLLALRSPEGLKLLRCQMPLGHFDPSFADLGHHVALQVVDQRFLSSLRQRQLHLLFHASSSLRPKGFGLFAWKIQLRAIWIWSPPVTSTARGLHRLLAFQAFGRTPSLLVCAFPPILRRGDLLRDVLVVLLAQARSYVREGPEKRFALGRQLLSRRSRAQRPSSVVRETFSAGSPLITEMTLPGRNLPFSVASTRAGPKKVALALGLVCPVDQVPRHMRCQRSAL